MFKRILCCLLVVAALALPAILAGCEEPNEYHSTYQNQSKTVVEQGEKVH